MDKIEPSDITPEKAFFSRRRFIKAFGAVLAAGMASGACEALDSAGLVQNGDSKSPISGKSKDEAGNRLTSFKAITSYNNYYEFTTDKEDVAKLAEDFKSEPWTLTVDGLVAKKRRFAISDLEKLFPFEERIYRLRCVEGWSMVIPWLGFPLAKLLKRVEPKTGARYIKFVSILDRKEMPGQRSPFYQWPYVEGLRIDEAMNSLTLLATGLYGKSLLNQCGAPIRLVVPWKYGFKSAKAIVRIELVKEMPTTFWMEANRNEYGFFANVNPDVPHPRWSQSSERRIGDLSRRKTHPFNGYAKEVADLYRGMDLKKFF